MPKLDQIAEGILSGRSAPTAERPDVLVGRLVPYGSPNEAERLRDLAKGASKGVRAAVRERLQWLERRAREYEVAKKEWARPSNLPLKADQIQVGGRYLSEFSQGWAEVEVLGVAERGPRERPRFMLRRLDTGREVKPRTAAKIYSLDYPLLPSIKVFRAPA